jgi:PAS domain S-box-containing protein
VFEQVTDGVLILDNEFNFIYFNANAVDYFQLTTESVKNIAMSDIGALGPNHPLTLDLNKALSNQQSIEAEYHIAALDKWLFAKIYPSESQIVVFLKDIDQEKKAKVDKAQTVERMEAVMKAINDVIWDYDVLANQIVYNDNFIELYKISKEDMAIDNTRIWSSRLHPVERDAVESHFLEVLRSNKLTWQDEYRFRRGDDTYAHVLDRGYIIRNSKGDAIRVIGTMIDITERKKNEVENANLALIIERTSDLVAYSDHEFNPIFINRAGIESLGLRDLEHYKQCHLSAFYTNTTLKTLTTLAVPHAIKHGIWSGETELKRLDGSVFPGSQIIISHKNKDGSLGLLSTIVRDISEIKNFQQNQKELTLQLRQLSNHLQNAVEDERANISREIHDELGQLLTAIKLKNQRQFELVGLPDTSALKGSLQDEIKSIDAAIKTVQRISSELRPSMLDDLGLLEAMEWQIQKVRKSSNLEIEFNHAINELIDDKHFKTSVFRILQESLTNIVRHSQANKVTIEFNEYENYNALTIIDNGVGFNINSVSKFSLGLLGMRERAATIGAELNIFSDYKAGTKIELKIPIFPPQQIIAN